MNSMMRFRVSYLKAVARAWADNSLFQSMVKEGDGWRFIDAPPNWDIDLRFKENRLPGSGFRPELTGSWVGPNAVLEFRLPVRPKDPAQHALALSEYYRLLPTPFGFKEEVGLEDGVGASGGHQVTSAGSGGSGMGHWSDALVLGGVVMRALAISWESAEFSEQLFSRGNTLEALQAWLGYSCPWNMSFQAIPSSVEWLSEKQQWSEKPRNHLTMWLPNKPETHGLAIALAAYNQTGDAYPLTCP